MLLMWREYRTMVTATPAAMAVKATVSVGPPMPKAAPVPGGHQGQLPAEEPHVRPPGQQGHDGCLARDVGGQHRRRHPDEHGEAAARRMLLPSSGHSPSPQAHGSLQ